jgi:hypothetical protein
MWSKCERCFREEHSILWPALSRTANLLAVLNVSLFFLTAAVRKGGYWYPVVSLTLIGVATLLILLPLNLHGRLGFYLLVLALYVASALLLGASIAYWLRHIP